MYMHGLLVSKKAVVIFFALVAVILLAVLTVTHLLVWLIWYVWKMHYWKIDFRVSGFNDRSALLYARRRMRLCAIPFYWIILRIKTSRDRKRAGI